MKVLLFVLTLGLLVCCIDVKGQQKSPADSAVVYLKIDSNKVLNWDNKLKFYKGNDIPNAYKNRTYGSISIPTVRMTGQNNVRMPGTEKLDILVQRPIVQIDSLQKPLKKK